MQADIYSNPLVDRYCSREMAALFSPRRRIATWRRLWIALAEAQHELGLDVSAAQIDELKATADDIDFERAAAIERELRHDVMAHVHAWREAAPGAGGILHLGATSCFVTDNADLLLLREGIDLVAERLRAVIKRLADFAREQASRPTLGFTHFQPAQLTTVGKRASLWLQDLVLDHTELMEARAALRFRGVKGTTGSQDSFLKLFDGDHEKVKELDRLVAEKCGFEERFLVTGQTYTRKVDSRVLTALSAIAQSAHKMSNDVRLLCHLREIEEPFESKQIGSSAMAYKRNPMRSERIGSLARFCISMAENPAYTEATQWLERTLDDSANRRLSLPLAFMAADAVLILCANVSGGFVVREKVIDRRVRENLPFIASEELMMRGVAAGGDRQELHEIIRVHSLAAADRMKNEGGANDLLERLSGEEIFAGLASELESLMEPSRFVGRAPEQVAEFLEAEVNPLLERFGDGGGEEQELRV